MSDNEVTLQQVVMFLANADQGQIDTCQTVIRTRISVLRQVRAAANLEELNDGDRVVLHGLSPKYLNGVTGVIEDIDQKHDNCFRVRYDRPIVRKGRQTTYGIIPANCVTKLA